MSIFEKLLRNNSEDDKREVDFQKLTDVELGGLVNAMIKDYEISVPNELARNILERSGLSTKQISEIIHYLHGELSNIDLNESELFTSIGKNINIVVDTIKKLDLADQV